MSTIPNNREGLLRELKKLHISEEASQTAVRANFNCEYCGRPLMDSLDDYLSWETDHLVPSSRGGLYLLDNLVMACTVCNKLKRNVMPDLPPDHLSLRSELLKSARHFVQQRRQEKTVERDRVQQLLQALKHTA